jgi:UDP-glucose 4-epimerase
VVRVLLTGGFGYLGLGLAAKLHRRFEIVAFGHPPRAPVPLPAGVTGVHGDLLDTVPALAGIDAVIHLAGGGGPARCEADATAAVRTNVIGTALLADAARAAGVRRLLFASTIAVYGTHRTAARPYRETDPMRADDLYGALKEAAERGWPGTSLRLANVYGAGCGVDLGVNGAVERFARAAAAGAEITIYGTGTQRVDYVHIDDVAEAFARALEAPGALPPAINIGGGAPVAIADLARVALTAVPPGSGARLVSRAPPPGPPKVWPDRSLEIDLAAAALGWRPRVPLAEGMNDLVSMMHRTQARPP